MEADLDLVDRCLRAYWLSTDASIDDKSRMQAVLSVVAAHLMQEAGSVRCSSDPLTPRSEAPPSPLPMPVTITPVA